MRLSTRIRGIAPSATLAITTLARRLQSEGQDVIDFSAGEPDFGTPVFIKDAAKRALDNGFTKYTDSPGARELRTAIAQKYQTDYGVTYAPDQIVVSNGSKHSLFNIFQCLLNPGDEVLLPVPYWVSYKEQIRLSGGMVVQVPTNNLRITATRLKQYVSDRTVAVVVNSPGNPTGMLCKRTELEQIAELAIAHDLTIISDETYEYFIYDEAEFTCMSSLGKDVYDRTVVTSAASKTYSMTGWRIGWTASSLELANAMSSLQGHTTSNPCSISQKAVLAGLSNPRDFLIARVAAFDKRRRLMVEGLRACQGIKCALPEGAFYVFPDITFRKPAFPAKLSVDGCLLK